MTIVASSIPFCTPICYAKDEATLGQKIFQGIELYFYSQNLAVISPSKNTFSAVIMPRNKDPSFAVKLSHYTLVIPLLMAIAKVFARAIFYLYHRDDISYYDHQETVETAR
jgi:hypothetical protein